LLDWKNQPFGFYAAPLSGYWVVQSSVRSVLRPGDVILKIDNTPIETFFERQQRRGY
jgi:hypothetical protein